MPSQPVAELRGVSKRFGGTQALEGVHFTLHAGEVHGLVGENGAGKSTLVKMLGGVHQPDEGELRIGGTAVRLAGPPAALAAGIVVIPQELYVVPAQTVAENVFAGHAPTRRLGGLLPVADRRRMRERTAALLERINLLVDPDTLVSGLGHAERQLVIIARALSHAARLLILDEPTASLEAREVERFFEVIGTLKRDGVGVVYVSHRLDEVERLADRITILRDGRAVRHVTRGEIERDDMIREMTGRDIEELGQSHDRNFGDPALETDEIAVRRRQIVGLAGLLGSGTTEMLRRLFAADRSEKSIQLFGVAHRLRNPSEAIARRIGFVPGERQLGLVAGLTVRENILLPHIEMLSSVAGLNKKAAGLLIRDLMQSVDIRPRDPERPVRELSGGNQQKVLFARWLVGHVDVLLLDEPTHGIDVGAKAQIHRLMRRFSEDGGAVVFASTESLEVLSVSDTVIAMRKGRVVARVSRDDGDAFSERKLRIALGG